jgi:8-oxo-dGTP diphosphatase
MDTKLFVATKAFIKHKDKILILRESSKYQDGTNSGKFDVPGGRIEIGQSFDQSLLREIQEETGLEVKIDKPFYVGEWRPVVRDEQWQIVGIFFQCHSDSSEVKLSEDHDEYLWIKPENYSSHNLIENLKPAFQEFVKNTK